MKIPPARADRFVKSPGDEIIAILLYGPDDGLVRERAEALVRAAAGSLDDPFRVAEVAPSDLRDDPARLTDEARALAFGGGGRAVRLRGAGDGQSEAVKATIAALSEGDAPAPSLIVVEAGELTPRAKLRKLFEDSERAAAVACYLDDGRGLNQVIGEILSGHSLRAAPDALAWLIQHLGADRRVTRSELDKLALYCHGHSEVTLEDCVAVIGDASAGDLDQAVFAAAGGEFATLETALARAFREGTNAITVIRAAQRHLQRLHQVTGAMAAGTPLDAAIKGLKPPPFFKVADRFRAQARVWPVTHVAQALALLSEAEVRCKTTGMPDQLICARALMQIAQAGRRAKHASA